MGVKDGFQGLQRGRIGADWPQGASNWETCKRQVFYGSQVKKGSILSVPFAYCRESDPGAFIDQS